MELESQFHPAYETLALLSSGDLPFNVRWRTRRHVSQCLICRQEVQRFSSWSSELRSEATSETLTSFESVADWRRLEREMLGNIAVGVAAARCIDKVGRHRLGKWRGMLVGTGLAAVFLTAWVMNLPKQQSAELRTAIWKSIGLERRSATGTTITTVPHGIAVRTQGATLTMLHPASAVVTMTGNSVMGARYIDEASGEVTITSVYGQ